MERGRGWDVYAMTTTTTTPSRPRRSRTSQVGADRWQVLGKGQQTGIPTWGQTFVFDYTLHSCRYLLYYLMSLPLSTVTCPPSGRLRQTVSSLESQHFRHAPSPSLTSS